MHLDLQGSGLFLDLVPIGRQRGSVKVIYLSYRSQSHKLNNYIYGCVDGAKEKYAGDLGRESAGDLH